MVSYSIWGILVFDSFGVFLFDFIFVIFLNFFMGGEGVGVGRGGGSPFGSLDTDSSYNCCILSDNIQEISENAMCSTQRNQLQFFY